MDPVVALFGLGCFATIGFACLSIDDDMPVRVMLALFLTMSWAISNIAWQADELGAFALIDLGFAVYLWILFDGRRTGWRGVLTGLAVFQLVLDAIHDVAALPYMLYALILNASFAAELAVVAGSGHGYVRRRRIDRFRDVRGPLAGS